jgi:hypothetical protein
MRIEALAAMTAFGAMGCCTSLCASPSIAHEFELAPPGIVFLMTELGECSGTLIEAEPTDDGQWHHRVLTAKHCFPRWYGRLPPAEVRAPMDGGYVYIRGQLELWGEGAVENGFSVTLPTPRNEAEWSENDWAIVAFTIPQRLQTIPLARTVRLRRGDRVALLSYLDTEHTHALVPHEHIFTWGSVSVNVPQLGHSGAPVVSNGEVAAMLVQATEQSVGCRILTGCRYRTIRYVSAATIRASAHRQGFLLAGEYNRARP